MRNQFLVVAFLVTATVLGVAWFWQPALWSFLLVGPLLFVGFVDYFQSHHTIRRNFPLLGQFRYLFEAIRPEINQYFVESNTDGVPFSREMRSVVYQRAKHVLDTLPFGTQANLYAVGYEWVNHSVVPYVLDDSAMRVVVGGEECRQPYSASLLNISAMSFGSLSKNAVLALNAGAKLGNFAHNTGEGGLSSHHLKPGGDIIWQVGTGYFGARNLDGTFDPELFRENAAHEQVKMVELKISQGAKPGHGGILPKVKITPEIARIRNVSMDRDVISPPGHTAFSTPVGMMEFIQRLRELSGYKPVGFKLCIGKRREFLAMCKAMAQTGILPDFITVDGGEGGTGAAPIEFSNHIGSPLNEALIFVHNALVGFGLRKNVRVICSGKVLTGFDIVKNLAIGADMCNSARGMMMALGCIQAIRCNTNSCPTGIATQNPNLVAGLVVEDKYKRVASFHKETVHSAKEIIGTMGLRSPSELRPWHRLRRTDFTEIRHYGEIYEFLKDGDLLKTPFPKSFQRAMDAAQADSFGHVPL